MKSFMENIRLKQALENLQLLEKNCNDSKIGFEPNVVVCMYLTEVLLRIVDIYPTKVLRHLTVITSFERSEELITFLDTTIGRMKRVEHYALNSEEIRHTDIENSTSAYDFFFDANYDPKGQLEKFLMDLNNRLNEIHDIMTDPRRSQAKMSYIERTFSVPIKQIASVLEAVSIGVANV